MGRTLAARLARWLGGGRAVARHLLDTNPVPGDWTHVTKVDPEERKRLPLLYPRWLARTSAVSVGGSSDVTAENTERTFELLAPLRTPVCHEPSGAAHVTERTRDGADHLLIPEVLNGDSDALVGELGVAVESVREELVPARLDDALPWLPARFRGPLADVATTILLDEAAFEAYIVQNPDSAAARESGVGPEDVLAPAEAGRRALAADRHLDSEIIYVEYSGTFGGDEGLDTVRAVDEGRSRARLWYGGGLADGDDVRRVREAGADTVVVGDAFHAVAEEEAELLAEAAADLPVDAERATVRDWVADALPADGAAVAYLSTVPDVDSPETLAQEYVTATVRAWLDLADRTAQLPTDPGPGAVRRALAADGEATLCHELRPAVGEAATDVAATVATALLGGAGGDHLAAPAPGRQ